MEHGLEQAGIDVLAIIGVITLIGFFVGRVTRRFGVPQVVGYIIAGVILSPSLLHVVPVELVESLDFVSELALGLIGFEMGLHLHWKSLRKLGPSIISIVLLQALAPFILVVVGVVLLTGNMPLALLLGVLSTATAPAATVDVLEEYKAEGPVTTSIVAVVGIDDALALITFSLVVPMVETTFGGEAPALLEMLELPFIEIGGSILLGMVLGFPLSWYIREYCEAGVTQVAVTAGVIFLATGLSRTLGLSLILATMTLGTVVINTAKLAVDCIRDTIEQAGPILYILFFALVGARFDITKILADGAILPLALIYMVLRILGKFGGAWFGGLISRTEPVIRNNVGLALLSQAGVAIGLALSIDSRFRAYGEEGAELGALVVMIITATTFVVQLIGPVLVKWSITRAGEIGQAEMVGTD